MNGIIACAGVISLAALSACSPKEISFSKDVQPVLKENCITCHQAGGIGFEKSGLDLTSYDSLMKGTRFGAVVAPGASVSSTVIKLVNHTASRDLNMPKDLPKLGDRQITLIKNWIDQGAKNN